MTAMVTPLVIIASFVAILVALNALGGSYQAENRAHPPGRPADMEARAKQQQTELWLLFVVLFALTAPLIVGWLMWTLPDIAVLARKISPGEWTVIVLLIFVLIKLHRRSA